MRRVRSALVHLLLWLRPRAQPTCCDEADGADGATAVAAASGQGHRHREKNTSVGNDPKVNFGLRLARSSLPQPSERASGKQVSGAERSLFERANDHNEKKEKRREEEKEELRENGDFVCGRAATLAYVNPD